MPNLLLTRRCVRKCPYCFASGYMSLPSRVEFVQWGDYISVLDYFHRDRARAVSLLGGEPTLHHQFKELVEYALQRGFRVRVFTSGIVRGAVTDAVGDWVDRYRNDARRIQFIVNVNDPADTPADQAKRQREFLALVGERATLSFNIYRTAFDLGFAFELISTHKLRPLLRLGLAHPADPSRTVTQFLAPEDYRAAVAHLAGFSKEFDAAAVTPDFDCGFPICAFSDEHLGQLVRLKAKFQWKCSPILDVGPDMFVWPCFPLHRFAVPLFEYDSFERLRTEMLARVRNAVLPGQRLFAECSGCRWLARGLCSGGCRSYALGVEEPSSA